MAAHPDAGYGTVFKIDAPGTLMTLHTFSLDDGAYPRAELIRKLDGTSMARHRRAVRSGPERSSKSVWWKG
jgi:hypothetical protein